MISRIVSAILGLFVFIGVSPVLAGWNDNVDWRQPPSKSPQMEAGGLYAVEVRCSPRGGSLEAITHNIWGRSRSLLIFVTKTVGTATPTADKLPSDSIGAVLVYSASNKDWTSYDYRRCSKDFLVSGSKLALIAVKNESDDPSSGPMGQFISGALGIVSPLFSFFTGQALPTAIAKKITNLQTASDPFSKILGAFKSGDSPTRPIDKLRTGTYSYVTENAAVSIRIRPIDSGSIVLDRNAAFRSDLHDQIKAAPDKIDSTKLDQSCRAARFDIGDLGFRSSLDISYAIIAMSGRAGLDTDSTLTCLTRRFAMAIVQLKNPDTQFWQDFEPEQKFTQTDIDRVLPDDDGTSKQPKFQVVSRKIDDLVTALAQYARNDPHPQQATDILTKLLSDNLAITDKTSSLLAGGSGTYKRFDFIAKLTSENVKPRPEKRYIRFGCYEETKDTTGASVDGHASSIFLVFKANNTDTSVAFDDVLALKPLFDPSAKYINGLIVSPDRAWIAQVLIDRGYNCNDFVVKKPAQASLTP